MPELPEVETVCRALRISLRGSKILSAEAKPDPIVFKGISEDRIRQAVVGATVESIGRKGKYFWICFDRPPCLMAHFGMSGWAEILPPASQDPKFTKLSLTFEDKKLAFTDARRLGRIWLADQPSEDPQVKALGFDCFNEIPSAAKLGELLGKRKTSIKAVLLDQSVFAGVGNYLADEALYQAKIAPQREAAGLRVTEISRLRSALKKIVEKAVEVGADENRFPDNWLFHHRWGGNRGADKIGRHDIVRETVAGRTTAWVPSVQK